MNYEVDIGDEPITELCKSDGDGEVTSERQFALCTSASEISVNECVSVVDLYDYKWQGIMTVLTDAIGQDLSAATDTSFNRSHYKVSVEPTPYVQDPINKHSFL